VEIASPGDETQQKLPFYAAHQVDEVLIVDPAERAVHWLALAGGEYRPIERSRLIDLGPSDLAEHIDWSQRERRRAVAARDAEILARTGPDPELAGLAEHAVVYARRNATVNTEEINTASAAMPAAAATSRW
jgi:Putative restriction endonuclease